MAKTGKTTGNLKMRSGPGMEFEPPIAFLVPDTELEILGEQGDWWKVRHGGKEGYVGKKYVAVSETETPAKEVTKDTGISAASADIARILFYIFIVIFLVLLILGLAVFRV